ncbi:TPA: hypothetical protein ACJINZ_004384 [Escherichia coli]
MKLIDLLVQELPKRGGWPDGAVKIHQDYDGETWAWLNYDSPELLFTLNKIATNARKFGEREKRENMVTRKEYESALAASQEPAWSGEGLPPVGIEAEVSVDGGRTWCSYKATSECNGMRLVEVGDFTEEFQKNNWIFRPVHSEAENRRDAFINAVLDDMRTIPWACDLSLRDEVAVIYDAIAAGKIPGVKLDG